MWLVYRVGSGSTVLNNDLGKVPLSTKDRLTKVDWSKGKALATPQHLRFPRSWCSPYPFNERAWPFHCRAFL